VAAYLFIDGGFLGTLISKASEAYEIATLSPLTLDYSAITGGFQRAFYYDAWPSRKNETEEDYKAIVAQKQKLFDRINRTPNTHTREGLTRSRSPNKKTPLEQKGVDILLAIDVFKHATLRNMTGAHIMATDLDFFPLFEALRDTPVSVHLHCFPSETSTELMSLADVVKPITPYTVLKWFSVPDRDKFVQRVPFEDIRPSNLFKEGICAGQPFNIYKEPPSGDRQSFFGHRASDPATLMQADRWEFIVWDHEDKSLQPVYFERSED
jgi:uncharacterized LabA/DUF88 family protein